MPWQSLSALSGSLPPLSGKLPADHERLTIPSGEAGTAATIEKMWEFVDLERRDGAIRPWVGQAIQGCEQKNYLCYAQSIYEWVKRNIKYVFDPENVELVERPLYILQQSKCGDCDSTSTLLAAMFEAIGLPARFVTVKADATAPTEYSHVLCEVQINGKWYGADVTMPRMGFGWSPPAKFPRKYWYPPWRPNAGGYRDDKLEGMSMLSEGPIPGVSEIPRAVDKAGDWRIDVRALNGLSGLSNLSGRMRGLGGMGGLGSLSELSPQATVSGVLDGSLYRSLKSLQGDLMSQGAQIASMQLTVSDPNAASLLDQALAANQQAKVDMQTSFDSYNQIANAIRAFSGGSYNPPSLSGMRGMRGITASDIINFIITTYMPVLGLLMSSFSSAQGGSATAQSFLQQAGQAARDVGQGVADTGQGILDTSKALGIVALVGVAGVGLYFAWPYLMGARKAGSMKKWI